MFSLKRARLGWQGGRAGPPGAVGRRHRPCSPPAAFEPAVRVIALWQFSWLALRARTWPMTAADGTGRPCSPPAAFEPAVRVIALWQFSWLAQTPLVAN